MTAPERRTQIIDAAVTLFAEHGFQGTTTRELAAAVGVSEPVLYQHFKTKRDLYTAIIERECERGMPALAELQQLMEANDDSGVLANLGQGILAWYVEEPRFAKLLLRSALERHEMAELFYETHVVRIYQIIEGYLEKRMRQGVFRATDPQVMARAFLGMFTHHGMIAAVYHPGAFSTDQGDMVQAMVDTFLNGIRAETRKEDK